VGQRTEHLILVLYSMLPNAGLQLPIEYINLFTHSLIIPASPSESSAYVYDILELDDLKLRWY
jgi:hypothetical protein